MEKPFEYLDFPNEPLPKLKADWLTRKQVMDRYSVRSFEIEALVQRGVLGSQVHNGKMRYCVLEE